MKLRRRNNSLDEGINVVPFIDILLVLLIFFMVSSRFNHNAELQLELPEANGNPQQVVSNVIELAVYDSGSYAINGRALMDSKPETLRKALAEVAAGDTGRPLILSADAKAAHQAVVTAMDIAGQLGFSKLSITTRRNEAQ